MSKNVIENLKRLHHDVPDLSRPPIQPQFRPLLPSDQNASFLRSTEPALLVRISDSLFANQWVIPLVCSNHLINSFCFRETITDQLPKPLQQLCFDNKNAHKVRRNSETSAPSRATTTTETATIFLSWPDVVQSSHPRTCIIRSDPSL